jgi:hypothetical protein
LHSSSKKQNLPNKLIVIWLDPNLNESDVIYRNSITRLQRISISTNTFTNINDWIQFINKIKDTKIVMIISEELIKEIWSQIKSIRNIYSIYVISNDDEEKENIQKKNIIK